MLFSEEDLYDLMGIFQKYLDSPLRSNLDTNKMDEDSEDESIQHELVQMAFCKALGTLYLEEVQEGLDDYSRNR